jgi:hypothetical protein
MNWIKTLKKQGENTHTLMEEMEQLSLKQQDALQKAVHEGMASYFNFLPTSLSSYPQSLQLEATLQICLLVLASRYPRHIVDINEKVLGPQSFEANGWTASDIIEIFESRAPQMLQAMARLENNTQRKGIYLLERSEETPAFWIHCGEYGEKMPPYQGNLSARQEKTGTKA